DVEHAVDLARVPDRDADRRSDLHGGNGLTSGEAVVDHRVAREEGHALADHLVYDRARELELAARRARRRRRRAARPAVAHGAREQVARGLVDEEDRADARVERPADHAEGALEVLHE